MSLKDVAELFQSLKASNNDVAQAIGGYDTKVLCMLGIRNSCPMLIIMSKIPSPQLVSSVAVEVASEDLSPDSYTLTFTMTDPSYEELFLKFCDDLLSVMAEALDEKTALSRMAWRYETWRSFWKNRPGSLSEEKTRGLAGELLYLLRCINQGLDAPSVVHAWIGPQAGDQDFVFSDGWTEVKTVGQAATEVQIASLEQLVNPQALASTPDVQGHLVIVRLHSNPAGRDCMTLSEIYKEVLSRLELLPHARVNFVNSIMLTGADMEHGTNETSLKFECMGFSVYDVNKPNFPRLIRGEVIPEAVTKLSYRLSIPALDPWKVEG